MGFEQLAALKAHLAAQAKAEKAAVVPKRATPPRARDAAPAKPARPVDSVVHTIARLQRRFPLAFPKHPAPKAPLKIGIFEELLLHAPKLALTEAELREAIKTWCRGARYWACLIEGAPRMDLAGHEAGQVRPEDAKRAPQLPARRSPVRHPNRRRRLSPLMRLDRLAWIARLSEGAQLSISVGRFSHAAFGLTLAESDPVRFGLRRLATLIFDTDADHKHPECQPR